MNPASRTPPAKLMQKMQAATTKNTRAIAQLSNCAEKRLPMRKIYEALKKLK